MFPWGFPSICLQEDQRDGALSQKLKVTFLTDMVTFKAGQIQTHLQINHFIQTSAGIFNGIFFFLSSILCIPDMYFI